MQDWEQKADWMRRVGARSAAWSGDALVSLELLPRVPVSTIDTAPAESEDKRQAREREAYESLLYASA